MARSIGSLEFLLALASALAIASAQADGSDIAIQEATVTNLPADGVYLWGDEITIDCKVANVTWGDGSTPNSSSFLVMFYLSGGGKDYPIAQHRCPGLPPRSKEVHAFSVAAAVSQEIPHGQYRVKVHAVYDDDYTQSNNIKYAATICVGRPCPDVAVQSVRIGAPSYRPGDPAVVTCTMKNLGEISAGGYDVAYYASTDTTITAGDHPIGIAHAVALAVGQEDTFDTTCVFPANLPPGDYYIGVSITCAGDGNRGNDARCNADPVWVGPFADLAVQSLDATNGSYQPGSALAVHSLLCNVGDRVADTYVIRYYASADTAITAQDCQIGYAQRPGLTSGKQDSFDVTCQLPAYLPPGACYIGAIVTCAADKRSGNNTGCDETPLTIVHPPGYVCGRATYADTSAWIHPIRYARVKIYNADTDTDPLNDRLLAETATDGDGNFGVVLVHEQTSGPQIYVKVFTEGVSGAYPGTTSTICTVKDDVLKSLYSLKSPLCPYPSETSTMVNLHSPNSAGAFMVYDSLVEGFHKTKVFFNAELDAIAAYWPSSDGGTYYWPGEGIWVARYDRGDRDVIMHEYGHYVADSHGFALGSVGLNPFHYWNLDLRFYPYLRTNEEAMNLAFRESWATLFGIAVQYGDTSYPYAGDAKYQDTDEVAKKTMMLNLETDTYPACSPGEFFDNMTACALWDIFDDQNDTRNYQDTLSDPGLVKIWTIVRDYKPMDTLDFWNSWFEEYDYRKEMLAIFGNHQINFKCPKGSDTVATFESGQLDGFAWTTKGDAPWSVVSDASHQGTYSARSGRIEAGQSSTLEVTMTCDAGRIGFWYKLSTEMGGDMLHFYIDGVWRSSWSGEKDWQRIDFAVQAGPRTFTWKYLKDGSITRGADAVWLDDIEFPVW